jgi:hypothetical protein
MEKINFLTMVKWVFAIVAVVVISSCRKDNKLVAPPVNEEKSLTNVNDSVTVAAQFRQSIQAKIASWTKESSVHSHAIGVVKNLTAVPMIAQEITPGSYRIVRYAVTNDGGKTWITEPSTFTESWTQESSTVYTFSPKRSDGSKMFYFESTYSDTPPEKYLLDSSYYVEFDGKADTIAVGPTRHVEGEGSLYGVVKALTDSSFIVDENAVHVTNQRYYFRKLPEVGGATYTANFQITTDGGVTWKSKATACEKADSYTFNSNGSFAYTSTCAAAGTVSGIWFWNKPTGEIAFIPYGPIRGSQGAFYGIVEQLSKSSFIMNEQVPPEGGPAHDRIIFKKVE